eukprot:Mycagemm_TRINITY_DN9406_c0_g1::TRINITY_DN9406_c0_g1_i1::g.3060::m.3060 type:complete len:180 gc:universal TRINITY_DN9406_c0_g1_i1:567-28(-)
MMPSKLRTHLPTSSSMVAQSVSITLPLLGLTHPRLDSTWVVPLLPSAAAARAVAATATSPDGALLVVMMTVTAVIAATGTGAMTVIVMMTGATTAIATTGAMTATDAMIVTVVENPGPKRFATDTVQWRKMKGREFRVKMRRRLCRQKSKSAQVPSVPRAKTQKSVGKKKWRMKAEEPM